MSFGHLLLLLPLIFYVAVADIGPFVKFAGIYDVNRDPNDSRSIDVLHYDVSLDVDVVAKSVQGTVTIRFQFIADAKNRSSVEFDCGDLVIDSVFENGKSMPFTVDKRRVRIGLEPTTRARELTINYHGSPKWGLVFIPERQQAYTVFTTSQWMVCVDAPDDKATIKMNLAVPANLSAVGNGKRLSEAMLDNKRVSQWQQTSPIPTYIFGFAVGPFQTASTQAGDVELRYLWTGYSSDEVRKVFRHTEDMLRFFEDKAGVHYGDKTYTQVLAAGNVAQEMNSFTAIRETYGREVLANPQDVWLGAHEFSHQWWGNMVTCRDWRHFWVNEGVATFLAAAFIEHRFGRANYMKEIDSYRENYEKVRAAGKDKSLVFPDWDHPTSADRTLVYDKGAYVLHLLREEMGDRAFWKGIRNFTRRYYGKSVVTEDFLNAMQEASPKPLQSFFKEWVYHQG